MSGLAVIIGAGPGVGAALARRLGKDGYTLALIARRESTVEPLGRELRDAGVKVGWAAADAGDAGALAAAVTRFVGQAGSPRVIHHNAVAPREQALLDTSPADLLTDLTVGAVSLLTAVRAVRSKLEAGAVVLATGGGAADHPYAPLGTLGVQKAALRTLVSTLDADLRPAGVRAASLTVNGFIKPDTALSPDIIADVLADLIPTAATAGDAWKTELTLPT